MTQSTAVAHCCNATCHFGSLLQVRTARLETTITNRIANLEPSTNGAAKPAAKKAAANRKPAAKKTAAAKLIPDHLLYYAYAGVAVMASLSAGLNGYANSLHAEVPWAGWGMGIVIPVIILLLGKVAGLSWKRKQLRLAQVTAGAGVGLLALSVWHCAVSIALLTGSPLLLAMPMAVAIDVGFCSCEVAALVSEE